MNVGTLEIVPLGVFEDEAHVGFEFLDGTVEVAHEVSLNSTDIHWILDNLWVVRDTKSLPINGLDAINRVRLRVRLWVRVSSRWPGGKGRRYHSPGPAGVLLGIVASHFRT